MKSWSRSALRAAALAALGSATTAQTGVTHVRIEGALDTGTQALLHRAVDRAAETGDRLLVEIDSPGGPVDLMWQMANTLLDSGERGVDTVAWVNDQALSAGALLAMACETVYMKRTARIGSALPVQIGPGGVMPVGEDDQVQEKFLSEFRSEFRLIATERGRPAVLAEAMVDPDVEVIEIEVAETGERRLVSMVEYDDIRRRGDQVRFERTVLSKGELFNASGPEAVALGLADGLADSLDDLVAKLGVGDVVPTVVQRTRSEDVAGLLYTWSPLLLILGFVLAYLEFKAPGFGLPGILSIACFGLVLFGRYLVGLADVPHLVLITVGIVLIAVELFLVPGTIWVGVAGVLAVLVGLVWSFAGAVTGFAYPLERQILFDEFFRVIGSAFVAVLFMLGLSRVLPKTPFFGRMVLSVEGTATGAAMPEAGGAHERAARVGAEGSALTALRPVGKVRLDADSTIDFEARADGPEIPPGSRVRVIEVSSSGRLLVEAVPEEAAEGVEEA